MVFQPNHANAANIFISAASLSVMTLRVQVTFQQNQALAAQHFFSPGCLGLDHGFPGLAIKKPAQ
jgi:hypothetical protein